MASTFAWLDHSEEQRRKVLDVIDLFKEQGTVDVMGFGTSPRCHGRPAVPGDGQSDDQGCLIPVVPWMYLRLEGRPPPSAGIAAESRFERVAPHRAAT
jgi:hypothetical protein